jgi:hypothetical protein
LGFGSLGNSELPWVGWLALTPEGVSGLQNCLPPGPESSFIIKTGKVT